MTENEGQYNPDLGTFDLCTVCLEIALDAAYSDGFQYNDDEDLRFVSVDVGEASLETEAINLYTDVIVLSQEQD
jgi:hypothetical protein